MRDWTHLLGNMYNMTVFRCKYKTTFDFFNSCTFKRFVWRDCYIQNLKSIQPMGAIV